MLNRAKIIELLENLPEVEENLRIELGRDPLDEELAITLGINVYEVRSLRRWKLEDPEESSEFELKFRLGVKNNEMEKRRLEMGLKQEELGARIGLTGASISQIESCHQYPNEETQSKIAKVLNSTLEQLFPEWLQIFTQKWKRVEKQKIINVDSLSLNSPEAMKLLPIETSETIERQATNSLWRDELEKIISELSPREKGIIKARFYDLNDLEEVGKKFGITRERVRQIEAKALEKIRMEIPEKAIREL